jgi:hypothetical protein
LMDKTKCVNQFLKMISECDVSHTYRDK